MIRTEPLPVAVAAAPWLEYFPVGGSRPDRVSVEDFPFTIGRNSDCCLHIDSGRVSREHAEILREGTVYRVRDLGSTNGTFVNGQQVEEAILRDGDLLVIADLEYTFCTGGSAGGRATATQAMAHSPDETTGAKSAREIVRGARRLQESLLTCGLGTSFVPIMELESNLVFGYEAVAQLGFGGAGRGAAERLLNSTDCRLAARLRQLHRLLAAEEAARHSDKLRFFVGVTAAEVGAVTLMESLARLRTLVAEPGRLVVKIPESAACDIPYFREFLHALRNLGIGVAYHNFAGGASRIAEHRQIAPDYIVLAGTLVSGLQRNHERQRKVEAVLRACQDLGCDAIAADVSTPEEASICRDLGCRFAQGEYFDESRPDGPQPFSSHR